MVHFLFVVSVCCGGVGGAGGAWLSGRKGVQPEFVALGGVGRIDGREFQIGGVGFLFPIRGKGRRIAGGVSELAAVVPKNTAAAEAGLVAAKGFPGALALSVELLIFTRNLMACAMTFGEKAAGVKKQFFLRRWSSSFSPSIGKQAGA
jgi:hypothetical protein